MAAYLQFTSEGNNKTTCNSCGGKATLEKSPQTTYFKEILGLPEAVISVHCSTCDTATTLEEDWRIK
jgi:hypothetical protein